MATNTSGMRIKKLDILLENIKIHKKWQRISSSNKTRNVWYFKTPFLKTEPNVAARNHFTLISIWQKSQLQSIHNVTIKRTD